MDRLNSLAGAFFRLGGPITRIDAMIFLRQKRGDMPHHQVGIALAGFTASLILVIAIDVVRYLLTGTLQGIPPLG